MTAIMSTEAICERAIDVLDVRGWGQGPCYPDEGPVCIGMAVWIAAEFQFDAYVAALEVVKAEGNFTYTFGWNDDPSRSYEDVVLALKRAAHSGSTVVSNEHGEEATS